MPISSDVNTIFAFADNRDIFHVPIALFLVPYKRKDFYVLLDEVKSSFIYTYSDRMKEACLFIEKSIIDYKKSRSKLLKPPSPFVINTIIRGKIKEKIDELANDGFSRYDTINRFVNKMLSDYSIISIYEDSEKMAEFREKYLEEAEKNTTFELNRFLTKFKDFIVVNFTDIESYGEWIKKIKNSKLNIFDNKRDEEDIRIAAQYMGYNQEESKLAFVTCDKEFYRSLNVVSSFFKQSIGKLFLIKPRHKPNKLN